MLCTAQDKRTFSWNIQDIKRNGSLIKMDMGKFIVFEGLNGSGKGTQLLKLHNYISSLGKAVPIFSTGEPNNFDENGKNARTILKQDGSPYENSKKAVGYFAKNRGTHNKIFVPMLEKGIDVFSDRYYESNFCFQGAQGISYQEIANANKNARRPDLTFIIDITVEEANKRLLIRDGKNRRKFDSNLEFMTKVRENYLEMGELLPKLIGDRSIVYINGMRSPEKVWEDIKNVYDLKFKI